MIEKRAFDTLGHANHGWLDAHHHFSFADYHDPARRGVGPLLVWNDDTIQPDSGFPMHPHRDMEIITYVRAGQIDHEDHLILLCFKFHYDITQLVRIFVL